MNSIWDAKRKVNDEAYGDMCTYLEVCGDSGRCYDETSMTFKGVLYDAESCHLISSQHINIIYYIKRPL